MSLWHQRRQLFALAGGLFAVLFATNFAYYPHWFARRRGHGAFPQFLLSPTGLLLDVAFVMAVLVWMWARALLPPEKEYLRGIVTLICAANLGVVLGAAAGFALFR